MPLPPTEPLKDDWLVRTPDGREFSTHYAKSDADHWAAKIAGTVEPHKPNPSAYWTQGEQHYDH